MAKDFCSKLCDIDLLRRSWHLARDDSRADFVPDPFRHSDFAFHLDEHLKGISEDLSRDRYHPKPIVTIDVPKSTLSVRPGAILAIEDKVVLFAIACLIAPHVDKKIPENVYSWRVKKEPGKKGLFHDHEILKFPFLKHATIQRKLTLVEPWYARWPEFEEASKYVFEKEGYNYLVVSDIAAYFENIDLLILRDILTECLPNQHRIIYFLMTLLEYWTWPTTHGVRAPQGLPQGNGVSSFLANVYLLPIDKAMTGFATKKDIKYIRYMDDVRVFAKDYTTAIESLFLMNEKLRELRLNIQASKTRVIEGDEIRNILFDDHFDDVNKVIDEIQKKVAGITRPEREHYAAVLRDHILQIKNRHHILQGKDLRLFTRIMTGFMLLQRSDMVRIALEQLAMNPDEKLVNKTFRYLRVQDRNLRVIPENLLVILQERERLFPFQEANVLRMLRYVRTIPNSVYNEAKAILKRKGSHWFVKQQAALLLSLKPLKSREYKGVLSIYEQERNPEVKRALAHVLAQLPKEELSQVINTMLFSTIPQIQVIGRFYFGLLNEEAKGIEQVSSIFREYDEVKLLDRLFEVEIISKSDSSQVKKELLKELKSVRRSLRRQVLCQRVSRIIELLESDLA
jgi:hypothetical protein